MIICFNIAEDLLKTNKIINQPSSCINHIASGQIQSQQARQAELDGREKLTSKRKVNEEGRDNPKTEHADVEEMIPFGWKMLSDTDIQRGNLSCGSRDSLERTKLDKTRLDFVCHVMWSQMNQPGDAPCDLELDMVRQASPHQFLFRPRIQNNDFDSALAA